MSGKEQLVSLAFRKSPRSSESIPSSPMGGLAKPAMREVNASAVKRRAQEIGIREQQLYWIAEKSLQTPLPSGWIEAATNDGYVYYFNEETGESIWHHPALDHYKAQYQTILQQRQEKHQEYERKKVEMEQQQQQRTLPRTESNASVISNLSNTKEQQEGLPNQTQNDFSHIDFEGKHPTDYWFDKFEFVNRERKRMEIAMESMEAKVTSAVIEQSELMHDKHDLALACKQMAAALKEANECAVSMLERKGHDRSELPSIAFEDDDNDENNEKKEKEKGKTEALSDALIENATAAARLMKFLSDDTFTAEFADDKGYKRSWEGVSKRITEEMRACFPSASDKENGSSGSDEKLQDLKARLQALAQIIVAFGEYVPAQERTYLSALIKHIRQLAPGSELVPLDAFATSMGKDAGLSSDWSRKRASEGGEEEKVRDSLSLEPPSSIAQLRRDLHDEREKSADLTKRLDITKHQYELVHAKYMGVEARLTDSMVREETFNTKFAALSESFEKMAASAAPPVPAATDSNSSRSSSGGGANGATSGGTGLTTDDIKDLVDKLGVMTSEVDRANKRAVEAESRIETIMTEERRLREVELPALRVKLEKKKTKNQDLCTKLVEIETVSKSYYGDLQDSMKEQTRLEGVVGVLEKKLDKSSEKPASASTGGAGAGGVHLKQVNEQLQLKLQDEMSRTKHMERTVADAHGELAEQKQDNVKFKNMNSALESQIVRHRETEKDQKKEIEMLISRNDRLEDERTSLQHKVLELKRVTLLLNDRIIELQGNIRVFARMRPPSKQELTAHSAEHMAHLARFPDFNSLEFDRALFEFDRVFEGAASQEDVYEEVMPAVRTVMNGSRVCIFAYGQTGSGKTHTMMGDYEGYFKAKKSGRMPGEGSDMRGVNVRALQSIFALATVDSEEVRTVVRMSLVEVYNEKVVDLLSVEAEAVAAAMDSGSGAGGGRANRDMKLFGTSSGGGSGSGAAAGVELPGLEVRLGKNGSYVEGLSEHIVTGEEQVMALIEKGQVLRTVASNNINEHSSRSHLVIIVRVVRENVISGSVTSGHMTLVDLAGSERLKTTNASGQRLREAQHINKSLSALGDVISSLGTGQKHVPYRNSKLTFLLQDSLREGSKVLMFVNVSPVPDYSSESTASLNFACRCRAVQLGQSSLTRVYK